MANKTDDLLLVLSQKEASMLRDIIGPEHDEPLLGKARLIQIAIAGLVLAGAITLGLLHPELARALVESVMLLIL